MTSKDVRDILALPPSEPGNALAGPSSSSTAAASAAGRAPKPKRERPEGISRELFALIGDHGVSLAEAQAYVGQGKKTGYKERTGRKNVKWRWTPYTPAHHPGGLRLAHWKPEHDSGEDPFEAFGRPGVGPNVMQYTQQEYDQHLTDPEWSQAETAYLFGLLREYDLRFLVVADRYAWVPPGQPTGQEHHPYPIPASGLNGSTSRAKAAAAAAGGSTPAGDAADADKGGRERRSTRAIIPSSRGRASRAASPVGRQETEPPVVPSAIKTRSMEEIKDRYYTICRRLVRSRPAADEAAKERLETAYKFDIQREISRKNYAASLFHLTRPQIQEEEALYVELQKMQQKQARYATERQELMKTMQGLDSGLFYPDGVNGNKVFGNAAASGIGGARASDGTILQGDKMRKRKRGEADEGQVPEVPEPPAHHPIERNKKVDPAADQRNNIYRVPPLAGANLGPTRSMHLPAYLRSTKLPLVRPDKPYSMQGKVWAMLEELGINPSRLVMPTRENVEKVDLLMHAAQNLLEMKKQHDRAEQELRILQAQKGMTQPAAPAEAVAAADVPVAGSKPAMARSESVLSSTPSDLNRSRQGRR